MDLEEISGSLQDFYSMIEANRNAHYNRDMGKEPIHFRNPMIKYLIDNLEDDSLAVDMFCGDLVVPLAILYLQKETGKFSKIRKVYAVDGDQDGGFDLVSQNSRYFGLESQVVPVLSDVSDNGLVKQIEEKPDISLVIEGSRYVLVPSYVWDAMGFFNNLSKLAPVNFTIQVGYIPIDYTKTYEYIFDFEKGTINTSKGDNINYHKGVLKRDIPEEMPFRFSRGKTVDRSSLMIIGSEEDKMAQRFGS